MSDADGLRPGRWWARWRYYGWPLALVAAPVAVRAQQPTAVATPLVFDGVTVVDVERGRLLPNQRVAIVGARIQAVGNVGAVKVPAGAQVVDARGKYLIPGLWDMHAHTPHAAGNVDGFYSLLLANGVTGFRDPGSPTPLGTLQQWRREILAGMRAGPPRQILSGQSIDLNKLHCDRSAWQRAGRATLCVIDTADARHVVDSLAAAGADMIKPHNVSREIFLAVAAESRRIGVPLGGHAEGVSALEASGSGARIIDHFTGGLDSLCWLPASDYSSGATVARCRPIAERLRRNGTWTVPTEILTALVVAYDKQSVAGRMAKIHKEFWTDSVIRHDWLHNSVPLVPSRRQIVDWRIPAQAGLPLLAGTDAELSTIIAGFSLHGELALAVDWGLTPLSALQMATLNPAKFLGGTDSLGTVAAGKLADLVLLEADPLTDITNTSLIRAVVANGRYFDRAALDQLLTNARAAGKPEQPKP